ncbi:hypothetical protein GCM10027093_27050 [Paraburkholderia jirisanensis]
MDHSLDVLATLQEILRSCSPERPFSADASLVGQGLGSLAATRFVLEVQARLQAAISVEELGAGVTLTALAAAIAGGARTMATHQPSAQQLPADAAGVPLLPLQQAFLVTSDPGYSADPVGCHIYREFDVQGIDAQALRAGWRRLLEHQPMLSARIAGDGTLTIGPPVEPEIDSVAADAHEAALEVRRRTWWSRAERMPERPLAVALVVSPGRVSIQLSVDAIVIDGFGLQLLLRQWQDFSRGEPMPAPPALSVARCVSLLGGAYARASLDYWRTLLAQAPRGPFAAHVEQALAARRATGEHATPIARRSIERPVAPAAWQRAKLHAERLGISPTSLVLAEFAAVVLELNRSAAASFVMTTSERSRLPQAADQIVGPFTSSMIVPVALDAQESGDAFAARLHQQIWAQLAHSAVPAVVALRETPSCAAARGLPVVFTSLLGTEGRSADALHVRAASCQTSGVALEHQMWEQDGQLRVHWDVADALLPPFAADLCIERLLARLHALGAAASAGPALSRLQQAYFVERSAGLGAAPCCAVFSFDATGLDLQQVTHAWHELVSATPALRSRVEADGSVSVLAAGHTHGSVGVTELGEAESAELEQQGAQLDKVLLDLPFPAGRWPLQQAHLLRSKRGAARLYLCFDLIMLDAKSIHTLTAALAARLYPGAVSAPAAGGAAVQPPDAYGSDAYWSARMRTLPAGPQTLDSCHTGSQWARMEAAFDGYTALAAACRAARVELDDVLMAAFAAAWQPELARPFTLPLVCCRPQDDAARPAELSQMAWLSFAPAATPDAIDTREPLLQVARAVQQARAADLRQGGSAGLTALSLRNAQAGAALALPVVYTGIVDWGQLAEPLAASLRWRTATPGIALDALALSFNDRLVIGWDYAPDAFAPGVVQRAFERYREGVERLLSAPQALTLATPVAVTPVAAVPVPPATAGEPVRAGRPLEPVHRAFERAAAEHADRPAVHWSGGVWQFGQLNRRANAIARQLRRLGAGPGVTVAVSLPRTPDMIAATLGVLKAGAAYVPVEPVLPPERAARMLEVADCRLALVLSTRPAEAMLPPHVRCIAVDLLPDTEDDRHNLETVNDVDTLAYVIFTSGSTGEPKGVAVTHRPLLNLFDWCQRNYQFGPHDLGVCVTSLGFDLSAFDILGMLGYGAALYLADEAQQRDPALLAAILAGHPVTFWNSAPTTFDQVSRHFDDLPQGPAREHLRLVFLSGDYTPLSLPPVLFGAFPRARLVSLGGATEAAVWSNFHEVRSIEPHWRSIPYGRPIDNARYYILDEANQPCSPGVEGELFIGGDVLSVGYYRRPGLTAERFVRDPFVADPAARMYRTGDRASFYPDGTISFCGRADRQVKVRGVRIELEEIEHALRQHPLVRDAIVMVRHDPSGDAKIVAYVEGLPGLERRALREFSQTKLPASMVPNLVHPMRGFPATSNGKLDRNGLPWPLPEGDGELAPGAAGAPAGACATPDLGTLTIRLGELFKRFLGREPDADRELWEQGATSFTMVQVSGALRADFGARLQVEWLTRDPSVRGIARMLHAHLQGQPQAEIPACAALTAGACVVPDAAAASAAATPMRATTPTTAAAAMQIPTPAATATTAAMSTSATPFDDGRIDLLDVGAKQAFLDSRANRRADLDGHARLTLPPLDVPAPWFDWRAAQRSFTGDTISAAQLGKLLGLLATRRAGERDARLYPSAGDTYGVQVYLWLDAGRVAGFDGGYYWYDGMTAALVRIGRDSRFAREAQFFYNRPVRDRAAAALFLVGEPRAIAPLYGTEAERFQLLEAGYIGQLLMLGQHDSGLGLCPIGNFDTTGVQASLQLHSGQPLLHSFLLGPVAYPAAPGVMPPLGVEAAAGSRTAPVAIVGHALRYPGAATPDAFWTLLSNGERALRAAPQRRGLDRDATPDGGFLDSIDGFDALAFSIAPSEAALLDPQARLLLEVVRECLERAGHDARSLQQGGERVGVFTGHLWHDYRQHGVGLADRRGAVTANGSEIAHRISTVFGFTGPSLAIDTACSSGLSALHVACTALAAGDCDSAIVCAVNLIAHPSHVQALAALGFVATRLPAGAFDGDTTGWAIGEGAGALLLRRGDATDAHADHVLAQVLATHLEQSGARASYGSPSEAAIEAGLRAVLQRAGLDSDAIGYVECAAAGGPMPDAAEWQALTSVFDHGVLAGTVKPNIGHLEAASGLSQLSKVLLQLEHGRLAPTLAAPLASPLVELDHGPVRLLREGGAFAAPARGQHMLINAVGSTGASAQAILRAAPARAPVAAQGPHWLLLSAASPAQLEQLASAWRDALPALGEQSWEGVCGTSQLARRPDAYRLAIEAEQTDDALRLLGVFLRAGSDPRLHVAHAPAERQGLDSHAPGPRGALQDWLAGNTVDWRRFWSAVPQRVPLPTYPFARKPYWIDATSVVASTASATTGASVAAATTAAAAITAAPPAAQPSLPEWRMRLRDAFAHASGIDAAELNEHVPLEQYGLNSRLATEVVAQLSQHAPALRLPATLLYESRDLATAASRLAALEAAQGLANPAAAHAASSSAPTTAPAVQPLPDSDMRQHARAIAVIGLAGRYPGADDVDALWQHLLDGADLVRGLPPQRARDAAGGGALMQGAFLDDVAGFDPLLFGIAPHDACRMDPQERVLLETVWHALEDACYPPSRLKDELNGEVGVFIGAMHNEYPLLGVEMSTPQRRVDAGATVAGMANRISYHLDLHGPSLTVDTMCSSSLSALQLAVDALRAGRIQLAIVGSVSLALHPNKFVQQQRLQMTASDARCRSFGAGGDGFIPGEGAAVLILRAQSSAAQANDRIQGLVLGCAVNHGGKVNGYTVPNPHAQTALVRAALADAGVTAASVSYVEAHGTGTALGDPIEARALEAALALADAPQPLMLGSIKSNLGHLEAAAGLAGVTKVLLQLREKTLVASLHAARGNPQIDWRRFAVPQATQAWLPRRDAAGVEVWRAGVSAFGAGGSNAHVVLEAAPAAAHAAQPESGPQLLVLSAATRDALQASARRLAAVLARTDRATPSLQQVATTLQLGREALRERWAAPCSSMAEALVLLRALGAGAEVGVYGRATPQAQAQACAASLPLDEVARAWVTGQQVSWQRSGPWLALPGYPFMRIRCWIDGIGDAVDVPAAPILPAAPGAPAPLAERVWRPAGAALPASVRQVDAPVLCVVNAATRALADALAQQLAPRDVLVRDVTNSAGPIEARPSAVVLLADLDAHGASWQQSFAHCAALARGAALAAVHIVHAVSGLHAPSAEPGSGAGAELAGLLYALAAEYKGTTCSIVDVGPVQLADPAACARLAAALAGELTTPTPGDVCLTPLGRLLPVWQNVERRAPAWQPRAGDAYAITGGTRGLGARLARELARRGARRLGLLGRTRSVQTDALVAELEQQGARVVVHYASVEQLVTTDAWLQAIERELGPLAGVFHCAGVSSRGGLALADRRGDDLADVMAPKSAGLAALLPAIQRAQPGFVVLFSSISAVVPEVGVGVGDYAAANRAMDYLAEQKQRRGVPQLKTVAWPSWRESNTAAAASEAVMQRHGLPLLSDQQAFEYLWTTMALQGALRYCPVDAALLMPPINVPAVGTSLPQTGRTVTAARDAANAVANAVAAVADALADAVIPAVTPFPPNPPADALPWLRELLAERTGLPLQMIPQHASFAELGVESVMLGRLVEDIEARIGQPLGPSVLLEYQTAEALAAHFAASGIAAVKPVAPAAQPGTAVAQPAEAARAQASAVSSASLDVPAAPAAVHSAGSTLPALSVAREAVAVIGMAVRVPGAADTGQFWRLLTDAQCAITEVPPGRWDTAALFDPAGKPGTSVSRWGGFVTGIEDFDAAFFGLTETAALALDPAVRLFMEAALHCLADAGLEPSQVRRGNVGVYVGARMGNYGQRVALADLDSGLGSDQNFIAAHLAHFLDLRGANMVVDSACSSSLSALHLACQSILNGDAEQAFAGGVDVLLDEEVYVQFTRAGALSPSGRCRTFDRHADGFVPGEGCAVFLLKRLSHALADGDRIHAVIEASALNNDGRTMGLTTPNPDAQKDVIRSALARAGRTPEQIGMVETHGTATMIGDPIELKALNDAYRGGTQQRGFCAVGSVKSNVGHLLSAAGAVGLAKAVLAVEHGLVPPTLFCDTPNPRFDLASSPFFIPHALSPWPVAGPRTAGVSAFGLGGSNAHVIVGEAPPHRALRAALAPPPLRRRRLWLERDGRRSTTPALPPLSTPVPSSLLNLQFEEAVSDAVYSPELSTS